MSLIRCVASSVVEIAPSGSYGSLAIVSQVRAMHARVWEEEWEHVGLLHQCRDMEVQCYGIVEHLVSAMLWNCFSSTSSLLSYILARANGLSLHCLRVRVWGGHSCTSAETSPCRSTARSIPGHPGGRGSRAHLLRNHPRPLVRLARSGIARHSAEALRLARSLLFACRGC